MFREKKRAQDGPLRPDPELWRALGEGDLLTVILADFYDVVFDDERLVHFFDGVDKEYLAQKQFGFMRSIITGQACYFGAQPRNAHHWMIISDELFDYREQLMEECLQRHNVDERSIARIREIDEIFRKQIVKTEARTLRIGGVEVPLEGMGTIEVTMGLMCDGCSEPMDVGDTAHYSIRTSEMYCVPCATERMASLLPSAEDEPSRESDQSDTPSELDA